MIGQYSKVAMGDLGQVISMDWNDNTKEFTIPLNLAFEPKRLLILLNPSDYGPGYDENTYIDTPKKGDIIKFEVSSSLGYIDWIKVIEIDKNKIKFSFISYSNNYADIYFLKYIAIG